MSESTTFRFYYGTPWSISGYADTHEAAVVKRDLLIKQGNEARIYRKRNTFQIRFRTQADSKAYEAAQLRKEKK